MGGYKTKLLEFQYTDYPCLEFDYTNYRGEESYRKVVAHSVYYGKSEWHPDPQWLMRAIDIEKNEFRDFTMKDMRNVSNL